MCVMSAVMDWGLRQPRLMWDNPAWLHSFEELLRRAKKYDEEHNQPDCELDEKRQALKRIADELGVEIRFP